MTSFVEIDYNSNGTHLCLWSMKTSFHSRLFSGLRPFFINFSLGLQSIFVYFTFILFYFWFLNFLNILDFGSILFCFELFRFWVSFSLKIPEVDICLACFWGYRKEEIGLRHRGTWNLGKLGVFLVNEEPKIRKSPPRPQVSIGVDRVLCMVIYPSLSTKWDSCSDSDKN